MEVLRGEDPRHQMLADLMEKAAEAKTAPNARIPVDPPGTLALENGGGSEVMNEMVSSQVPLRMVPVAVLDVPELMQQEQESLNEEIICCDNTSEASVSAQNSIPLHAFSEGTTRNFLPGFLPGFTTRNSIPLPGFRARNSIPHNSRTVPLLSKPSVSDDQAHAPDDLAHVPDDDRTNDRTKCQKFFEFKSGNISSPMGWDAYGDAKNASKMSTFDDPYETQNDRIKGSDRNTLTDSMEK